MHSKSLAGEDGDGSNTTRLVTLKEFYMKFPMKIMKFGLPILPTQLNPRKLMILRADLGHTFMLITLPLLNILRCLLQWFHLQNSISIVLGFLSR